MRITGQDSSWNAAGNRGATEVTEPGANRSPRAGSPRGWWMRPGHTLYLNAMRGTCRELNLRSARYRSRFCTKLALITQRAFAASSNPEDRTLVLSINHPVLHHKHDF